MDYVRTFLSFLARVFMSAAFLAPGINTMIYWTEAEKEFMRAVGEWQTYTAASDGFQIFFGTVLLWAPFVLAGFTLLQMIGSLLLLFGIKEKFGAFLLVLFLLPMTLLTEHFWFLDGLQQEAALSFFLRDFAILGALFVVILHGARGNESPSDPFSREG